MTTPTGTLPTGYLQGLLDRSSPKPWVYQIVSTVIRDGLPLAEKYTHQICNEHGPLMEETGGWETEGRDPDFELAALAPVLAEEVIQLREAVAELEAQLTAEAKAPARATRPEDVPPGEAWLVNVNDGKRSGERVVALKHGRNVWRTADGAVAGSCLWFDEEVTLIAPLAPVTPTAITPAHPEYLETLQDYEDAPVGTVVKMLDGVSCLYLAKLDLPDDPLGWHMPGEPGCLSSGGLSGRRRRVIYWPEQEVVE